MADFSIKLPKNREIFLRSLIQVATRGDFLETSGSGNPSGSLLVEVRQMVDRLWPYRRVHVLDVGSEMDPTRGVVASCGDFLSYNPTKPDRGMASQMLVVWLQDGFGTPHDERVIQRLSNVPWSDVAEDFEW